MLVLVGSAALIAATSMAADEKKPDAEGFVQLFNGKDLTGWKTHPDDKAKWEVVDGAIVGSGPAGHLFSERGDYENFIYRVEAKISDKGNSGQYFRARYQQAFPPGYEAQINATGGDRIKTGSLYPAFDRTLQGDAQRALLVLQAPHKPDEWFTQEVTARGNHIVIKVNNKVTVDFTDAKNTYTKGHFAIQQHDPGSKVWVRKVEVKELTATK
jgi:hypothetical protein